MNQPRASRLPALISVLVAAAWLGPTAHAADCAQRTSEADVASDAAAVEQSLAEGREQGFTDGLVRLQRTVGCLDQVPAPATMARLRVVEGVRAFGAGEVDLAAGSFLAARALVPDAVVPVYPREHEIWGVFQRWDPVRAERERLPAPKAGDLYVDGYPTRERFVAAPALVQRVTLDSVESWVLAPGEQPTYAVRHPVRNSLLITSASLVGVGAGCLAASIGPRDRFRSGEVRSVSELAALRSATNTWSTAGLVAWGLAAGAAGVAVAEWGR